MASKTKAMPKRPHQRARKVLVRDSDTSSSLQPQVVLEPSVKSHKDILDSETSCRPVPDNAARENEQKSSVLEKAQLHSTRKLVRRVQFLSENNVKCDRISEQSAPTVSRSATTVNFPLESEWYRDLVPLEVREDEVIGQSTKKSKHPGKAVADPEPKLENFDTHNSRTGRISPTDMVALLLECDDNLLVLSHDVFGLYEQCREWDNTELPFQLSSSQKIL